MNNLQLIIIYGLEIFIVNVAIFSITWAIYSTNKKSKMEEKWGKEI